MKSFSVMFSIFTNMFFIYAKNMNKFVLLFVVPALLLVGCARKVPTPEPVAAGPEPFTAGPEVFNPDGSHIQGIAASEDALYISQDRHLAKVDWTGKLLKSREVPNHTGDLCWYKGELFAA